MLSWSNRGVLPFPLGIIHQVEVQFSSANSSHAALMKFQKVRDELYEKLPDFSIKTAAGIFHDSINESAISTCKADFLQSDIDDDNHEKDENNSKSNGINNSNGSNIARVKLWKPWLALASRSIEYPDFGSFVSESAMPGGIYSYRIRYRYGTDT